MNRINLYAHSKKCVQFSLVREQQVNSNRAQSPLMTEAASQLASSLDRFQSKPNDRSSAHVIFTVAIPRIASLFLSKISLSIRWTKPLRSNVTLRSGIFKCWTRVASDAATENPALLGTFWSFFCLEVHLVILTYVEMLISLVECLRIDIKCLVSRGRKS